MVILETFRADVTAHVWGAHFWLTHTLFNVNLCVQVCVCVPFVPTFSLGKQDSQIEFIYRHGSIETLLIDGP